jgi:shikimate kinase
MPLWLIGMMGSGKTEVGARLGQKTGCEFLDTDRIVEHEARSSIADIFSSEGEAAFRIRERNAVITAAAHNYAVVATGGGTVIDLQNVETMRRTGPVIWLQADPLALAQRVGANEGRPLLEGFEPVERLTTILRDRSAAYEAAADHVVVTDRLDTERIVELVEDLWNAS